MHAIRPENMKEAEARCREARMGIATKCGLSVMRLLA